MNLEREAKLTRMSQELEQIAEDVYQRTGRWLSVDDKELMRQRMRDLLAHELPARTENDEMADRLKGRLMQAEFDLYRIREMSVRKVEELAEADIKTCSDGIEFLTGKPAQRIVSEPVTYEKIMSAIAEDAVRHEAGRHSVCAACKLPIELRMTGVRGGKWYASHRSDSWHCGNDPAAPVKAHAPEGANG